MMIKKKVEKIADKRMNQLKRSPSILNEEEGNT